MSPGGIPRPSVSTSRLPPDIKDLYLKASKNPIYLTRLSKLSFRTLRTSQTWLCHPLILNLFAKQFDLDVPVPGTPIDPEGPAFHALGGLGCAVQMANPTGVKALLESVWPKAWKWIDTIYRGFVLNEPRSTSSEFTFSDGMGTCIVSIIFFLVEESPSPVVLSTEGLLRLVLEMYLVSPRFESWQLMGYLRRPADALAILIGSPLTDLNEFRHVLGSKPTKAAILFCEPIKRGTNRKAESNKCLAALSFVHLQLLNRHPSFYIWLSPKIVITTLCEALKTARSMGDNSLEGVDAVDVLIATVAQYGLHTKGNHSWIIYALRAHLVQSLLKGKIPVHCQQVATVATNTRIMLCTLASYAFYPAVLRHLTEESTSADAIDVSDTAHRDWSLLVHYIKLLRVYKEKFDESLCYVPQCGNTQCVKDPRSWKERRCTGCKLVIYCSTECQSLDWSRHRHFCKSLRPERDVLTSPRFIKFLQFLIETQLASNEEEILELQRSTEVPLPAILYMDFSNPSNMMRPIFSIGAFDSDDSVLAGERIPLLVPCINIPTGHNISRKFVIVTDISGELFGWYEETCCSLDIPSIL